MLVPQLLDRVLEKVPDHDDHADQDDRDREKLSWRFHSSPPGYPHSKRSVVSSILPSASAANTAATFALISRYIVRQRGSCTQEPPLFHFNMRDQSPDSARSPPMRLKRAFCSLLSDP